GFYVPAVEVTKHRGLTVLITQGSEVTDMTMYRFMTETRQVGHVTDMASVAAASAIRATRPEHLRRPGRVCVWWCGLRIEVPGDGPVTWQWLLSWGSPELKCRLCLVATWRACIVATSYERVNVPAHVWTGIDT